MSHLLRLLLVSHSRETCLVLLAPLGRETLRCQGWVLLGDVCSDIDIHINKMAVGRILDSSSNPIPLPIGVFSNMLDQSVDSNMFGVTLWIKDTIPTTQHVPATCLALLPGGWGCPVPIPLVPPLARPALLLAGLGSSLCPEHGVSRSLPC